MVGEGFPVERTAQPSFAPGHVESFKLLADSPNAPEECTGLKGRACGGVTEAFYEPSDRVYGNN